MYQFVDFVTKNEVVAKNFVFTGETAPWELLMDMTAIKATLNLDYFKITPPNLAKYLPLLPIQEGANFVSLGEAATPLLKSKVLGPRLGIDLYFKIEGKNPTGSFKDRGSAVEISVAKELGAQAIILASTGNMAASCACYAAFAKIPCFVLVPELAPITKLAQVIAFGGHIVQIKGHYNDAADLAKYIAGKMGFYLAGDYAFRVEGQKTAAFELIDQLLFDVPDMIVVPIGCGTNIAAYAKGFDEYQQLGLINKTPQLIGVQATGADAVVESFRQRKKTVHPLASVNTIASAIAVPNPIDGIKALHAIYATGGAAIAISDQDMLEAQYTLSTEEGLFVESASAATLAALIKHADQLRFNDKKVVCILTGDGLKDSQLILKAAIKPPIIAPNEHEFMQLYEKHFFDSRSVIFADKNTILFETEPSIEQVEQAAVTLLNAHYDQDYLKKIQLQLRKILEKGKTINVADFQDSIQNALATPHEHVPRLFSVIDFVVETKKDQVSSATVTIQMNHEQKRAHAQGVGPVDAVIHALCQACHAQINYELLEYNIDVRHHGSDAVASVEVKLSKDDSYALGIGTSPDMVQASIEAFVEAYNMLDFQIKLLKINMIR